MNEENLFRWGIGLWVVNPDSVWYGAYLKVSLTPTALDRDSSTRPFVLGD